MSHKVSKQQAKYVELAKPEHHCGASQWDNTPRKDDRNYCKHFSEMSYTSSTGQCKLVFGGKDGINRKGGCELFTRAVPREKAIK